MHDTAVEFAPFHTGDTSAMKGGPTVDGFWSVLGLAVLVVGVLITSAAIFIVLRGHASLVPMLRSRFKQSAAAFRVTASSDEETPSRQPAAAGADVVSATSAAAPSMDRVESLIGRALLAAEKSAEAVMRAAQAKADEIIGNAETIAHDVMQASCSEASEILQKAREEADVIMGATKQQATASLALLQTETDRLVLDAHQAFRQAQRSVEQSVASFSSRLERHAAEHVAGLADGNQDASVPLSNDRRPAIDPHGTDLVRSFALADAEGIMLGAGVAATPPAKNGQN